MPYLMHHYDGTRAQEQQNKMHLFKKPPLIDVSKKALRINFNEDVEISMDMIFQHLKIQNFLESLDYPIRRRDDLPETYSIPIVRKKFRLTNQKLHPNCINLNLPLP
jgi:uncharacterized UBP type Zn finger protein